MSDNAAPEMTLEAIRSVPLFGSLDDDAAIKLRSLLKVREVARGAPLFRAGDKGDAMYLIAQGRVRISVKDEDKKEIVLAELAGGDFFGEMSIIDGKLRSADAKVIEDARLAILSRDDFMGFIHSNPVVTLEMLSAVFKRLRRTDELLRQRVSRNVNDEQQMRMTLADRMADLIAEFGGSWKFIGAAIGFLIFWVLLNTWLLHDRGFDPFPYILLNLVLGMITGLQAPIIMMSQNRQAAKDRLSAAHDYEVNLKAEIEIMALHEKLDEIRAKDLTELLKHVTKG